MIMYGSRVLVVAGILLGLVLVVNGDCTFPESGAKLVQAGFWLSEGDGCTGTQEGFMNHPDILAVMKADPLSEEAMDAFTALQESRSDSQRCVCRILDEVWDKDENGEITFTPTARRVFEKLDLSRDCIMEMYRISQEARNSALDEGFRMIKGGAISAQAFSDPADPNAKSGDEIKAMSEITNSVCPDPRTTAQAFDINKYLSENVTNRDDFIKETFLPEDQSMPNVAFRKVFREAGERPTGNVPKGCMTGAIVGTGVMAEVIRSSSAESWNGKCFFSLLNNTLYNILKTDTGPDILAIKGHYTEQDAASFLDGKPSVRFTYPKTQYWEDNQNLYSNGDIMIDYHNFIDEVREHPDIPGMFLGLMWLNERNGMQGMQRIFGDYMRVSTNIGDVRFGDEDDVDGVVFNSKAVGDGSTMEDMYRIPVASFVLFQTEKGYEEDCLVPCQ